MAKTAFNEFLRDFKNKTYPNRVLAQRRRNLARRLGAKDPAAAFELSPRDAVVEHLKSFDKVLEIGPFCNPLVEGRNVSYLDVLDKAALEDAARSMGLEKVVAPHIDYVSPYGDLRIIKDEFDAIVSSHNIEHQPDLISHLRQATSILRQGGKYFVFAPDKRYCFDHFLPETTVADVLEAYYERRTVHTRKSLINNSVLSTHNDPGRHWRGDHADANYYTDMTKRLREAVDKYESSSRNYIDCHAWQFTPDGFRTIIRQLYDIGMIELRIDNLYETRKNSFEFAVILAKN